MRKNKKETKKEKFSMFKNTFYALKIIHQCAPRMMVAQISMQTSFWFFTGFIKDVLFLKVLLDLIMSGGTFKEYALLVLMLVASELIATGINCFSDYYGSIKWKKFYKNLNDKITLPKGVTIKAICYGIASEFLASKNQINQAEYWNNKFMLEIFKSKTSKARKLKLSFTI